MKLLKKLSLLVIMTLFTVISCTNKEEIIDNISDAQESASMQNVVAELDAHFNEDGTLIESENPTGNIIFDFCFDFVYPIELIYNNGATVTVDNFEELILVIINSTIELYVVGIEFPFEVEVYNSATGEIEIETINNEADFIDLLESCFFDDCECTDEYDPVCVKIVTDNGVEIITYPNECEAECDGFTEDQWFECEGDCNCTDEYDPVCVEKPNGEIYEFDNACIAICEGFTEDDFVDCPPDECDIYDLEVEVGECNPNGVYSVTINFEYENPGNDFFDVFGSNGDIIGTYPLADLPVTIDGFMPSGTNVDFLVVCINDQPNCCADVEWEVPNCNQGDCSISGLEVEVGECNPSGTYALTIDFEYENPGNDFFDVFVRNDEYIGTYALADLPITIENFETSGLDFDFVEVCINDVENCCSAVEWESPNCNGPECSVSNIEVEVGPCTSTETYELTLSFDYENPGNDFFDVFVRNNEYIGTYELADLPITIENFPLSNLNFDFVKVCINDVQDCCDELEWEAPNCN